MTIDQQISEELQAELRAKNNRLHRMDLEVLDLDNEERRLEERTAALELVKKQVKKKKARLQFEEEKADRELAEIEARKFAIIENKKFVKKNAEKERLEILAKKRDAGIAEW